VEVEVEVEVHPRAGNRTALRVTPCAHRYEGWIRGPESPLHTPSPGPLQRRQCCFYLENEIIIIIIITIKTVY